MSARFTGGRAVCWQLLAACVVLALFPAGCGKAQPPTVDAGRLDRTREWAWALGERKESASVVDVASPEWAALSKMLQNGEVPPTQFMLGSLWRETAGGKGTLTLEWYHLADAPSPIRTVALRLPGQAEARYPLYVKPDMIRAVGYVWIVQLPMDLASVAGVEATESEDHWGAVLYLRASRQTLQQGVEVQVGDGAGVQSNWVKVRASGLKQAE